MKYMIILIDSQACKGVGIDMQEWLLGMLLNKLKHY
jgi:hypothetical protein